MEFQCLIEHYVTLGSTTSSSVDNCMLTIEDRQILGYQ